MDWFLNPVIGPGVEGLNLTKSTFLFHDGSIRIEKGSVKEKKRGRMGFLILDSAMPDAAQAVSRSLLDLSWSTQSLQF
jgi:hypothetical protein